MLSSAISYALSKEKEGREWGEFISVCACGGGGGEMRESSGGEPVYCSGTSRRCMGTKRQGGYRVG